MDKCTEQKKNGIVYTNGGGTAEVTHSRGVTTYTKEMGAGCQDCDIQLGTHLCRAMECGHTAQVEAHPKKKCKALSDTAWRWKRVKK